MTMNNNDRNTATGANVYVINDTKIRRDCGNRPGACSDYGNHN